jgi:CheY-like chemotaxis protein
MGAKGRILIVEDELLIAMRMRRNLELAGYEVLAPVTTGSEALASVAAQQPDLVLIDVGLSGGLDGIQTAEAILERVALPIVFMTGYSGTATIQRAKRVRPAAILEKPIFADQLQRAIEAALGTRPNGQQHPTEQSM